MPRTISARVTLSEADADEGDHERDQGQLRDRAAGVADRDGRELAGAPVAEVEADRQRDRDRDRQGDHADLDLRPQQLEALVEAADLERRRRPPRAC